MRKKAVRSRLKSPGLGDLLKRFGKRKRVGDLWAMLWDIAKKEHPMWRPYKLRNLLHPLIIRIMTGSKKLKDMVFGVVGVWQHS